MEAGPPEPTSLDGLLHALAREPGHEGAWAIGTEERARSAAALMRHCRDEVLLLHDRFTGGAGDIDHLAIAPAGIWVIAVGRYRGRARIERGAGGQRQLRIDGRDRSALPVRLSRQLSVVGAALEEIDPNVEVRGAVCLLDAALPVLRGLSFEGLPVLGAPKLARRLNAPGPLSRERAELLCGELAPRFPPAESLADRAPGLPVRGGGRAPGRRR